MLTKIRHINTTYNWSPSKLGPVVDLLPLLSVADVEDQHDSHHGGENAAADDHFGPGLEHFGKTIVGLFLPLLQNLAH